LSCDVGMVKPDKEIYELLVERLKENGVVSEETVFIDDKEENLVPARELGIETILFEDSEQMIRDLREIGVSI
jgi:putative hydrolase of the HAD superfamily